MWSFFSRDPLKDLPFELGEKVDNPGYEEKSIWTLHHGKRKNNGDPVSIFAFDVKNASEAQVQLAKASFKKLKTMRHPNILTYIDGIESDKSVCIVTEPVVPLEIYLQNHLPDDSSSEQLAVSWGLHQLAKALNFLTNDCSLVHNNVCTASVFVDRAGEWKLGGMEYMYAEKEAAYGIPVKILPSLEKYDPPEKAAKKQTEKWSTDMWCLGCLVWEVFNGSFAKTTALKSPGKIPKSLISQYCELVSANPRSRPTPAKFIESCRSKGGFMDNKFVSTMLFLEEIQIKDQESKSQFFSTLTPSLASFPPSHCKEKILPLLIHAYEYGNAGSAVLAPLFKLGKLLDSEEYQTRIVPCVVKLFSSTDRATRVKLLQQIENFVEHLTPSVVNDQIFPSLVTGFMDSNPVVREQTIKSMLHLADKLNYKNLNEELLKHFARLQSRDDQGGIRTNTTVCLGKIACHLNPQVRQRVLSSAYLRAIKDPFPPARQAGILAMAATHNFFTLQESAVKLLPALCTLTMDPDKTVRDQAFRAIKCFLGKLEKVSENPDLMADAEKDVNAGGSAASGTAGWAGWAVSGMSSITSKIYSGKAAGSKSSAGAAAAKSNSAATAAVSANKPVETRSNVGGASVPQNKVTEQEEKEVEEEVEEDDEDNWDDAENWGEMEEVESTGSEKKSSSNQKSSDGWDDSSLSNKKTTSGWDDASTTNQKSSDGWDDDEDAAWDSIDDNTDANQSTGSANTRLSSGVSNLKVSSSSSNDKARGRGQDDESSVPASSYNWGQQPSTNEDDFFNSLLDKRTTKPQSSLSLSQKSSVSQAGSGSVNQTTKTVTPNQSQKSTTAKTGAMSVKKAESRSKKAADKGWEDDWGNDTWG